MQFFPTNRFLGHSTMPQYISRQLRQNTQITGYRQKNAFHEMQFEIS